MILTQR